MKNLPMYKNPVPLIPGGCPQFLDFRLKRSSLNKLRRYFREDHPANSQRAVLCCLALDENDVCTNMVTACQENYDYELDARKIVEDWLGCWLPVPILRQREQQWEDGGERFEYGPSNWARCRLMESTDDPESFHLTFVFDMGVEEPIPVKKPEEGFVALTPNDVLSHSKFKLADHVRDNAWFLNLAWVDQWLHQTWIEHTRSRHKGGYKEDRVLEYLASYLTLLEVLQIAIQNIAVQVINPQSNDHPIEVDLVLDIGNSRTTGILVETLPQRVTNLNDSYLLQLRDIDDPQNIYTDPFETRIEFTEASFGNEALSRRSGRRTAAFYWPSMVRVGPEAVRLATFAVNAEGSTGMSSPKRYLWDERPWQQTWRYNTHGGAEPLATRGPLAQRINEEGTPLLCLDLPEGRRNPNLRKQSRDIAFESRFTRSSLMMFMMIEILMQALTTINSPGQRSRMELPNRPRRLRSIVLTVPPGMPVAEQRIYRRWVDFAVRLLWDALGWTDAWQESNRQIFSGDYRANPLIRCNWDEATCTQLVYLYNELTRKFQGDAWHLFRVMGKIRKSDRPSLRIATIDIGGGTTDLSITTFLLDNAEGASTRIRPQQEFRDGFSLAGDDILKEVINSHFLPELGNTVVKNNLAQKQYFLGQLCGRDLMESSYRKRNLRAQFVRQVAVPVALSILNIYEKTSLLEGSGEYTCKLREFFTHPFIAENQEKSALPFPITRYPWPGENVIRYVEDMAQKTCPDFKLMDMSLRIIPKLIDTTVRSVLFNVLHDLSEVIQDYDCDILLLTGRPSRWSGIISSILSAMPIAPSRIFPMSEFLVGTWYPFADSLGRITDPKTTVVVGAILCTLAEARLEGFSFDTSKLIPRSTACFIGEMDIAGQVRKSSEWFHVDVDDTSQKELSKNDIQLNGPIAIGFRQLEVDRWPTTRFYYLDFSSEEARRRASGKLPYTLSITFTVAEDSSDDHDIPQRDEGTLTIEEITDRFGNSVRTTDLEARLQTLPQVEGYWLDTGIVYRSV